MIEISWGFGFGFLPAVSLGLGCEVHLICFWFSEMGWGLLCFCWLNINSLGRSKV